MYEKVFTNNNKVISVLWSNKRDNGLWFGPAEWKECRLGIQLLPLLSLRMSLIFLTNEFVYLFLQQKKLFINVRFIH